MATAERLRRSLPPEVDRASPQPGAFWERPRVEGKFLYLGHQKLYVKGVTYGTFRPTPEHGDYPDPETVRRDFGTMRTVGINAIRTYTVPPVWLLDLAYEQGLRVMVGLPWEQHVAFLDERRRRRDIEGRLRSGVRSVAGHPAILCYSVGNEIPSSIVRWHGRRRIERFIARLTAAVREEDPGALVTYVSFPTTEYLELPDLDLVCFNVFLESEVRLDAYLARLQNLAGDRPLILTELGLDARSNGEDAQARAVEWQVRSAFASGSAGAFVFSWTDEWHRGGHDVEEWDFGLTTRDRRPKPSLAAVREAFADVPFPRGMHWPRISVVVCTHNGARTLDECLNGSAMLDYPDFEVIVVDDGSTDRTAEIAKEHGVRVISTPHRGLSNARNVGMQAATGMIVAYLDDDAYPDEDWLTYLAAAFEAGDYVAVGGPNLPPRGDGPIAECVANSPGGPVHVLLSDREAEHIPGCNMAFRKEALEEIGGFDPQFWTAGDDVDVCWRLQDRGWKLGFSPSAMVWHHRRNSVRAFWRQQRGYGRAEALLERKWPDKYNGAGHLNWNGRIYSGPKRAAFRRQRVYQGVWGTAPFQFVTPHQPGRLASAMAMPEWFLLVLILGVLSVVGALWTPLLAALPLLGLAVLGPIATAFAAGAQARLVEYGTSWPRRWILRALTTALHASQPIARLVGRLSYGLTPWRRHASAGWAFPWLRRGSFWSEHWRAPESWLRSIEWQVRRYGTPVVHGGPLDRWDLEVRGGALGGVRLRMAVEEHGMGRQMVRFRSWPVPSFGTAIAAVMFTVLAVTAVAAGEATSAAALAVLATFPIAVSFKQVGAGAGVLRQGLEKEQDRE